MFHPLNRWLLAAVALLHVASDAAAEPMTITIGQDPNAIPSNVGWTDGVCYKPMVNSNIQGGDSLEFIYDAHNVYQMASKEHFLGCNFTDAVLLSQVGESPYTYEIGEDYTGTLYFACQVGDHCASGTQKLQVSVSIPFGDASNERFQTTSSYLTGISKADCNTLQETAANGEITNEEEFLENQRLQSDCSEPLLGDDGYYTRTCLSGPATLTPGGVINRLMVMHYPYPRDHRVAIGQRTFEFVYDNVNGEGVTPANVNQLYVHHLSGRVVFGQGSEGIRQEAPDAPFPKPYTALSGDEGEYMIFHIIDLRQVDDWLSCIECRCPVSSGNTYFDGLTQTGNITGGVDCCSNCTDIEGDTLDYRMRYNVSYTELDDEVPVRDVQMLTADISPAVDKVLEHDVYSWEYLPENEIDPEKPYIQSLVREMPFNELFKWEFFQQDYAGPGEVELLRCVAHLHVASIDMWLEDMETGERLCDGKTFYGTDPETDAGFLIAVSVDTYDPPKTFPADRMVRFVTEYNATQVHTGVMGYWFVFVAGQNEITRDVANLTVDVCMQPTCNVNMLPEIDMAPFQIENISPGEVAVSDSECEDTLWSHPACTFGGVCDCEDFVNADESPYGCDGFYASAMGDIEVRSVCTKFCGCDVEAAIEQAANIETRSGEDCVDTLAESPTCSFGGLCDCETFVNAAENEGCGGLYKSTWGDVETNSVCANYCGCEGGSSTATVEEDASAGGMPEGSLFGQPTADAASGGPALCDDQITSSPMCRFANICECEDFVNAPESEGCGGYYRSDMGDIFINDICAAHCDACGSMEEIFQEAYTEIMSTNLRSICQYDTPECQAMLNNMYSCGSAASGIEDAHPMVQSLLLEKGQEVAMEMAKLGDSSLHAGQEPQEINACVSNDKESSTGGGLRPGLTDLTVSAASGILSGPSVALVAVITSALLL